MDGVGAEVRWSILVAFHDSDAQRRAMQVCDNMVARFWPDMDLQVHWCSFNQLTDANHARDAAARAAGAKIVIVSTHADAGLPSEVGAWLDEWCRQRHGREGALIGLVEGAPNCPGCELAQDHLRNAAHRAGMDYLTHEPACAPEPLPDEVNWFNSKAAEVGSVLGEMLDQQAKSTGRP